MGTGLAFVDCTLDFSSSELSYLEGVNGFISRNTDKFSEYFPDTEVIVAQFMDKIENTIACNQDRQYFTNKRDFDDWFHQFVMDLISWNVPQVVEESVDLDASVDDAILQLQSYLWDMMTFNQDMNKPLQSVSSTDIIFNLYLPEEDLNNLSLHLNIDQDGKYDLQKSEFDTNIILGLDVDVDAIENDYVEVWDTFEIQEKNINVTANWELDMNLLMKDDLYLKLNDAVIDYNLGDSSLQMEEAMINGVIEAVTQELQWKYINITEWTMDIMPISIDPTMMIDHINTETMIEFYKDWDKRYGRFKPEICELFDINMPWMIDNGFNFNDSKSECEREIYNMRAESVDQWYLILNKNMTTHSLGFTPAFVDGYGGITANHQEIISWNNNEITKFNLTLESDFDNYIDYTNGTIDASFEDYDYLLNIDGDLNQQTKTLNFDFFQKNENLSINGVLTYGIVGNTQNFSIYADFAQEGINVWDLTIESEKTIDYIPNFDLVAPTDTISIEELEETFSGIGGF